MSQYALYKTQTSGNQQPVPIERVTLGLPVIDTNHAQIHAGNAYSLSGVFTIPGGATKDITVYVPPGTYVHYQATDISTNGGNTINAYLYEDITIISGGTAITPVNRRRLGTPQPSQLTVLEDPTIQALTTELLADRWYFPKSSTNQIQNSISKSDTNEWVLKQDCTYLFRIVNSATDTVVVNFRPFWYEEDSA